MTAKTTRILKEARPLFWPWCAVVMMGVLLLILPWHAIGWISTIGFFLGIPLLATLALGGEFQHRTFSLLLSQPIGRMEIWGEKMTVTLVAVISAALVFALALRMPSILQDWMVWAFVGAWTVAAIASATFWTLFTRSTVGGVALNFGVQSIISFAVPWADLAHWLRGHGYISPASPIIVLTATLAFMCYAGAMLWLGRRKLSRFQVTGGMAGDDLLMAGPDVMPGALARWLRCRPSGAVLNLIRKELRLLRPVWLISLLAVPAWIGLILFVLVHERGSTDVFTLHVVSAKWPAVVWGVGVAGTWIIAILGGSLALGEEKTLGTHSWHMTLPVRASLQWRIKLITALFAGCVGAWLLPMLLLIAGGSLLGSSFLLVGVPFGKIWLLIVLLLSFAGFWCACATNGSVPAVLCVFPAILALGLASHFGEWAGRELVHLFVTRFDLFASFRFTTAVVSTTKNSATIRFLLFDLIAGRWYAALNLPLLLVPILIFALIQSYRLFRTQSQERIFNMIRYLFPLAIVAFLCTFSSMTCFTFVVDAWEQDRAVFAQTFYAIEKIQPGAAKLEATHPLQLTEEDLAKAFPLSERTRRWLRNSRVTIVPIKDPPHHFSRPGNPAFTFAIDDSQKWYLATIYLAGGTNCTWSGIGWAGDLRMLYVVCQ